VNQDSGVDATGSSTWNVNFRAGSRYQFVCDVHADSMYGSFNAGDADSAPTSVGGGGGGGGSSGGGTGGGSGGGQAGGGSAVVSPGRNAVVATLVLTQGPSGRPTLALAGKLVRTLSAGTYRLVVTDSSRRDALTLQRTGAKARALTGLAFVGKRSLGVTLAAGQWKLFPSAHPASAITFRVT
jgi:hypothetical protein